MRIADEYGIDPLRDGVFSYVANMSKTRTHTVNAEEAGNPQLIAHDYYKNTDMYEVILIANGLMHSSEVVAGMTLIIPDRVAQAITTSDKKVAVL